MPGTFHSRCSLAEKKKMTLTNNKRSWFDFLFSFRVKSVHRSICSHYLVVLLTLIAGRKTAPLVSLSLFLFLHLWSCQRFLGASAVQSLTGAWISAARRPHRFTLYRFPSGYLVR